jgi:hypothetical protein
MPAVELEDHHHVDRRYHEVEDVIQQGMEALVQKRALPLFR